MKIKEQLEKYLLDNFDFNGYTKDVPVFDRIVAVCLVASECDKSLNISDILKKTFKENKYNEYMTYTVFERSIYRAFDKMFPDNYMTVKTLLYSIINEAII